MEQIPRPEPPYSLKPQPGESAQEQRQPWRAGSFSCGLNGNSHTQFTALFPDDFTGPGILLEATQGMEKTLRITNDKSAHTLKGRDTYLATKDKDKLDMVVVLEGDPILFN